jgi:hypothetical protein
LLPGSSPLITGRIPYIVAIEAPAASRDDAIPRELISPREEIGTCDANARPRAATGTRPGTDDQKNR